MDDRMAELEAKVAFAEDLLEELNLAVYRQQQQMDRLQRELETLRRQLQESMPGEPRSLRDEIPPHY